MKLYFAPGACSFVPHVLLEATGEPFEPVLVKLHKKEQDSPEFRAVNPRGQVPVLVDGPVVITQILAITDYLHTRFAHQHFLPADPLERARAWELLAWMNNTAHPTFTHVFMPWKFAAEPQVQAAVKAYNTTVYRGLLGELEARVAQRLADGRPWLGGEHLGPLDAYALTLLRWGGLADIDPAGFPVLWAHANKLAAHPAAARAIARERLQLNLSKSA